MGNASLNRIEGVEVEKDRLIPLVLGNAKPRDRSEEEILGYRKTLTFIHNKYSEIDITPSSIVWKNSLKTLKKITTESSGKVRSDGTLKSIILCRGGIIFFLLLNLPIKILRKGWRFPQTAIAKALSYDKQS